MESVESVLNGGRRACTPSGGYIIILFKVKENGAFYMQFVQASKRLTNKLHVLRHINVLQSYCSLL